MAPRMTAALARTLSVAEQYAWYRRVTSGRARSRVEPAGPEGRSAAGGATAGDGSASAAGGPAPFPTVLARVERPSGRLVVPFGRHLAFGPDPSREIAIAWQVPAPIEAPFVRLGRSPGDFGHRVTAELRTLTTSRTDVVSVDAVPPAWASSPIEQYYLQARISGLRPSTTYYYTVGHAGWDGAGRDGADGAVGADGVRSFTTAPDQRMPFTFTAFGDQGVTYDAVATANLVRAQRPAFHLHAGDLSYAESGGAGLVTDQYDARIWDSFLAEIEPVASRVPWQIATGNHEMEAWYSPDGYGAVHDRFVLPTPDTTYYAFTYGNVAVVSLDANDVSYELPANLGYSGGAQTAWLAGQLSAFRARADIDFIVVYFHHCAYCTCSSHSSEGGVRAQWTPLFDTYSVDLVINGHNHVYERTDPLKAGAVTTVAPPGATVTPASQGTTYITAGGGGEGLYAFSAPDRYEGSDDRRMGAADAVNAHLNAPGGDRVAETVEWSRVRYTGYCLVVVDCAPAPPLGTATLTVRSLDERGAEIDRVVLARGSAPGSPRAASEKKRR